MAGNEVSPGGANSDSTELELFTYDSAIAEYTEATGEHALPDGSNYPGPSFTDTSGSYQKGYGRGDAEMQWNCAWGREYLATLGSDADRASAALIEFKKFFDTATFTENFAESAQIRTREAVDEAVLGDPTSLRSVIDGGCAL